MKMKSVFIVFLFLICGIISYAQSDKQLIDKNTGGLVYFFQSEEIHGHPFFKDKWMDASITINGHVFPHIITKIDTYNNKVVFNRNDTAFELGQGASEICFFPDPADPNKKMVFKNGFDVTAFIKANKYLEVLAEGKLTLLKDYHKELEEYTEYGNAVKQKRFREVEQYYVGNNGQFTGMGLSKKNLENALQAKWPQVEAFLKQKELSGKDEKSWVAAFAYFNTL